MLRCFYPFRNQERDKFAVTLKFLANKQDQPNFLYLHELVNMAEQITNNLFSSNRNPLKSDFELANSKLWLIADAISKHLDNEKSACDKQNNERNTPLHLLCSLCKVACDKGPGLITWNKAFSVSAPIAYIFVKLLSNVNANGQNHKGDTPLHILATSSEGQLGFNPFLLLFAYNARTNIKNNGNQTCFELATNYSRDASLLSDMHTFTSSETAWQQIAEDKMKTILDNKPGNTSHSSKKHVTFSSSH